MKIFVDLTRFMATASRSQLAERLTRLEDAGVTGISVWDHIFSASTSETEDWRGGEVTSRPADPLTSLAAVAGLAGGLEVHTAVVNSEWIHPALLLRQYSQLAVLIGGERVTAGLGMGWNNEEFDAIGMKKPSFQDRSLRLRDTMRVARELYDTGTANFEGQYFSVRQLPLAPLPKTAPRLLIAGSSDGVCETAGRYADVLNLYGHPKYGALRGRTNAELHNADSIRRLSMTVEDAVDRMDLAKQWAAKAGRPDALTASVHIFYAMYGSAKEVAPLEARICREYAHIEPRDLSKNPYILKGEPAEIADSLLSRQEQFGLNELIFRPDDSVDFPGAESDPLKFCEKVLPLL